MRVFLRRCAPFVLAGVLAACGESGDPIGVPTAPSPTAAAVPSPTPSPTPAPSQPACAPTLTNLPATLPARGGTYTLGLVIAANCLWTATAQAEGWASIAPTSGRDSAAPTLRVSENVRPDPRTLVIDINGQSFRVVQDAITCIYTLSGGTEIGEDAGRLSLVVETQPLCAWTATSSERWVAVRTPGSTGSGTINLDIERNTGDARQAFVTVANQRVAITQRRGN